MLQKFLFLVQVWAGRRQVLTGFSSIYTHFGDRFVQVWSSLALVFVWAWVRFEQVREQQFLHRLGQVEDRFGQASRRSPHRLGTGLYRFG